MFTTAWGKISPIKPINYIGGNAGGDDVNSRATKTKETELAVSSLNALLEPTLDSELRQSFFKNLIGCIVALHNRNDTSLFLKEMLDISSSHQKCISYNEIVAILNLGINGFGYTVPQKLDDILNGFGGKYPNELYSNLTQENIRHIMKYLNFDSYIEQLDTQKMKNLTYSDIKEFIDKYPELKKYPLIPEIYNKETNHLESPLARIISKITRRAYPTIQIKKWNPSPNSSASNLESSTSCSLYNTKEYTLKLAIISSKCSEDSEIIALKTAFVGYYNYLNSDNDRFKFAQNATNLYNNA